VAESSGFVGYFSAEIFPEFVYELVFMGENSKNLLIWFEFSVEPLKIRRILANIRRFVTGNVRLFVPAWIPIPNNTARKNGCSKA
jgi:hypothetical protein